MEGLSATGLRSIRYFKEIEGIDTIIANDLCADAFNTIKRNLVCSNFTLLSHFGRNLMTSISLGVSLATMIVRDYSMSIPLSKKKGYPCVLLCSQLICRFHVIDLDPYGSATMFLDAAVQAVDNGGLLCITCTDSAVLCGSYKMQCFTQCMLSYVCPLFMLQINQCLLEGRVATNFRWGSY
jgi:tRNA (guanine26-N2/guanine27-N2)-dimethyltransferase